jgi:7-cyano-7-deazaguanine synthase
MTDILNLLPETKGCVIILSGGLDSTIAMRLAVEKYGSENVSAITFFYGQRQAIEIEKAKESTAKLGVKHQVIDATFLNQIAQGFSANVDRSIQMPTIKEVIGDPQPVTYLPNRNMIFLSIGAAYAETRNVEYVITGLQSTDEYGYWDTTARFVDKMNEVTSENRKLKIKFIAPFVSLSKYDEIKILQELDGNIDLLKHTLTCYDPDEEGRSCGACPSCAERLKSAMKNGLIDPIPYSIEIPWNV